jgi:mannose-1-phosphate guanylyltransferase
MTVDSNTPLDSSSPGICVIMAGGRGTRFWPLSRTDRPKQLQALSSGRSLLRDTFTRVEALVGADRILVVTSGSLAEATRAELPELPAQNVICEPVGRNTAPCAVLGVGVAGRIDPKAPVALLPADHFIPDDGKFREQLQKAFDLANARETVLTVGIRPSHPETGYGYIRTDGQPDPAGALTGLEFVEKPDLVRAEEYVRSGRYFWNSGIFVWNPGYFSNMTEQHIPEVCHLMEEPVKYFGTEAFDQALETAYRNCPAESVDVAVMEKLPGFQLLEAAFRWSDLGSWDSWGELAPELPGNNRGLGDLLALESQGNIVRSEGRLVALLGVDDLIVVDTPDVILVTRKDQAQRIKEIIEVLEKDGRDELL